MLKLTALILIVILYVVPLNIPLYNISRLSAIALSGDPEPYKLVCSLIYITYAAMLFSAIYLVNKYIVFQNIGAGAQLEEEIKSRIKKYTKGQEKLNIAANITILMSLLLHILFLSFDIKLIAMGILCTSFVYRK